MANKYIIDSTKLMGIIDSSFYMMDDIGLSKLDLLALVIEYIGYISSGGKDTKAYLDELWLLDPTMVNKIAAFIDEITPKMSLYYPELLNVLEHSGRLRINEYNNHIFILERTTHI